MNDIRPSTAEILVKSSEIAITILIVINAIIKVLAFVFISLNPQ